MFHTPRILSAYPHNVKQIRNFLLEEGLPFMSNSHHIAADSTADTTCVRTFVQQAIDHYPRLAAFSFKLELPYRETMNEYRSLILRFHTEVWQRAGEYSRQRQQARRHSPPTVLRWLWEAASAPGCGMIMLMNLDTLGTVSNPPLMDSVLQEMNTSIREAWRTVTHADNNVDSMLSFIISRTEGCLFLQQFSQLQSRVNEMVSPVMVARTGGVCEGNGCSS